MPMDWATQLVSVAQSCFHISRHSDMNVVGADCHKEVVRPVLESNSRCV